jgi:hypothetical protein
MCGQKQERISCRACMSIWHTVWYALDAKMLDHAQGLEAQCNHSARSCQRLTCATPMLMAAIHVALLPSSSTYSSLLVPQLYRTENPSRACDGEMEHLYCCGHFCHEATRLVGMQRPADTLRGGHKSAQYAGIWVS